ncbi:MAG: phospholipid scramblase family protein [Candidatus Kapabacteria bacterium]|jgi:uncharacterized protein YxjI|nr:phospholipid scramblase family protein [Candidatus Kapabacteria bacterium]
MHPILAQHNAFAIREKIGIFKAANSYDFFHPETGEMLMQSTEEDLGLFTKILRFTDFKTFTPFDATLRDAAGRRVIRVSRGISFLFSRVEVFDENDVRVGAFQERFSFPRKKIEVLDNNDNVILMLRGSFFAWDFRFFALNSFGEEEEVARISKEWAGLAREIFTTADNYFLGISSALGATNPLKMMILAAVICVDMVFKERTA